MEAEYSFQNVILLKIRAMEKSQEKILRIKTDQRQKLSDQILLSSASILSF